MVSILYTPLTFPHLYSHTSLPRPSPFVDPHSFPPGTRRVLANEVYQQYIKDKDHYHMNATSVSALTYNASIVSSGHFDQGKKNLWDYEHFFLYSQKYPSIQCSVIRDDFTMCLCLSLVGDSDWIRDVSRTGR